MDLDEYVWRNKTTLKAVADETGICQATISHLKNKKIVPKLTTAIKLFEMSDGEIDFVSMLPEKDRLKLDRWMNRKNVAEIVPIN